MNSADNKSCLCKCDDGRQVLTVTNGDKLIFFGIAKPGDDRAFDVKNNLEPYDMGRRLPQGVVGGYGGTARVTVADDESYVVTGNIEGQEC